MKPTLRPPACPACGNYLMPCTATATGIHPAMGAPERHFKVTLSERQLQTAISALETLSAGDPEAEAENESTLAALDDAEEVK